MTSKNDQEFDERISNEYGIKVETIAALRADMQTIFWFWENRITQKIIKQFEKVIRQVGILNKTIDSLEKKVPTMFGLKKDLQKQEKLLKSLKSDLESTSKKYPTAPRTYKKKLVQYAVAGYYHEKGEFTKTFNLNKPTSEGSRFVDEMVKHVANGKFTGSVRGPLDAAYKEWKGIIPKPSEITLLDGDHIVYD